MPAATSMVSMVFVFMLITPLSRLLFQFRQKHREGATVLAEAGPYPQPICFAKFLKFATEAACFAVLTANDLIHEFPRRRTGKTPVAHATLDELRHRNAQAHPESSQDEMDGRIHIFCRQLTS